MTFKWFTAWVSVISIKIPAIVLGLTHNVWIKPATTVGLHITIIYWCPAYPFKPQKRITIDAEIQPFPSIQWSIVIPIFMIWDWNLTELILTDITLHKIYRWIGSLNHHSSRRMIASQSWNMRIDVRPGGVCSTKPCSGY